MVVILGKNLLELCYVVYGKKGTGKIGTGKMGTGKMVTGKMGTGKMDTGKIGKGKIGTGKIGTGKKSTVKKEKKKISNVTHNNLLPFIHNCHPIEVILAKRYIKFVWSLYNSN